jgi:hypothetical protein
MPNSKQHQDKAQHNRTFLNSLDLHQYADWASVAAFYTAVHLVERLRTHLRDPADQHSIDHGDRLRFVQRSHRGIHTPFHELYNAALVARYQTINSFNTQFSDADVKSILVDTYLVEVEKYVASHFPPPPLPPTSAGT